MRFRLAVSLVTVLASSVQPTQGQFEGGEAQFLELQQKLELDTLELRHAAEKAYQDRCNPSLLRRCDGGNYHDCESSFPNPICPAGDDFQYDSCKSCGTRWDYSTSSVRFPPSAFSFSSSTNSNRLDPAVVEDVCFSRQLDEFFVSKIQADKDYWANWGIENPSMHFGSTSGAFRIYPARPQEFGCNDYDPRLRPWYVAGSSGPKNVVLVLDTSGSMEGLRLLYLKQAAARIIDTLTIGDRVALITFSNGATDERIEGRSLVKVTASTKKLLKERIDGLEAVGSTNFYAAFRRVFRVMEEAIPQELVVRCNTAVLFLTDGEMTDPPDQTEEDVLRFVQSGIADLENKLGQPVYLFSYSISENDDVHDFPKQLACNVGGVWSKLVDDRNIVEALASYSNLFSMGLGEGRNDDFTAWVEPYIFSTNGKMGVTVSAPAFDRSVDPPKLIGVVGIDIYMSTLDNALGVEIGSSETLDRLVQASTAKCPRLEINECRLEDFRSSGLAGSEAQCGASVNCNTTAKAMSKSWLEQSMCSNQEDLPNDVLANHDYQYLPFEERACCNKDKSSTTDIFGGPDTEICRPDSGKTLGPGPIAGIAVSALLVVVLAAGGAWWYRRRSTPKGEEKEVPQAEAEKIPEAEATAIVEEPVIVPMKPPKPPTDVDA